MIVAIATALLSAVMVGIYLHLARARDIVDVPNERSSHTTPTPNGGGAALFIAFVTGVVLSGYIYGAWDGTYILLAYLTLFLMALGIIDDLVGLSVFLRLSLYALVCVFTATMLLHDAVQDLVMPDWLLVLLAAFVMLWSLNLYNFMDGIDGLAAIQTMLACAGAAILSVGETSESGYTLFCLLLGTAHCGFLIWNWPPAKLFMGDAGSVPTGFALAALVFVGAVEGQLNPLCWLILLAVFITDATWTLVWRICTRQAFTQPHRQHAYQRLSRRWRSHLKVDTLLLLITALWLFPFAWAVQMWPEFGLILVILVYLPLVWGMAKIGRLE